MLVRTTELRCKLTGSDILVEILRGEHHNTETLLRALERELNIFDRAERPDYEEVQAVIRYLEEYPDCCHHPKEGVVFAKLKGPRSRGRPQA